MLRIPSRADNSGARSALSFRRRTSGASVLAAFAKLGVIVTRAAPWRPDIDQHRYVISLHMTFKAQCVNFDRMVRKEWLAARATAGVLRRPTTSHPVDLTTMTTNDVLIVAHCTTSNLLLPQRARRQSLYCLKLRQKNLSGKLLKKLRVS